MATLMNTDTRERLRQNFLNHDPTTHTSRWEKLWENNDMPWDQGLPSPALVDLLNSPKERLPSPQLAPPSEQKDGQKIKRKRALVPGCGTGYDVLLFASYGYDAYGVEAAETALAAANKAKEGHESKDEYKVKDEKVGRGEAKFLFGDFFKDEWWDQIEGSGEKEGFDVIYDYTFLCALPPPLRPKWAARMSRLLAPNGRLICLEFPTYKPPSAGGPPWAVRPNFYIAYLSKPGEEISLDGEGLVTGINEANPERNDKALVRIAHWKPERTHQIGKDTDSMSVWKHYDS